MATRKDTHEDLHFASNLQFQSHQLKPLVDEIMDYHLQEAVRAICQRMHNVLVNRTTGLPCGALYCSADLHNLADDLMAQHALLLDLARNAHETYAADRYPVVRLLNKSAGLIAQVIERAGVLEENDNERRYHSRIGLEKALQFHAARRNIVGERIALGTALKQLSMKPETCDVVLVVMRATKKYIENLRVKTPAIRRALALLEGELYLLDNRAHEAWLLLDARGTVWRVREILEDRASVLSRCERRMDEAHNVYDALWRGGRGGG